MVIEQIKIEAAIQEAQSFVAKLDGSRDDFLILEVVQANLERALWLVKQARNS